MPDNDPGRTAPRTPSAAERTTAPAPPAPPADTADGGAIPNRTTDRPPSNTPADTMVRAPSDVERLEQGALAEAAQQVAGYVVLGELGRGGMGVVYKARHVKLNRVVALKMMLGERGGRADLVRFLAEAEAIAAVRHENVVQVFEYGEAGGRPYMVLEFCPGGTLAALLPTDRVSVGSAASVRDTVRLLARVARGVAAAHAQGIVHRDLKPGNVFLDAAGVPKVADFGLVKHRDHSDVTRTGQVMGTPAYMSPEQAKGESKFVGPQADVWALGVILYQGLTGARPFASESALELLLQIATADPTPPRAAVPALPRDLELICLKCLAKNPADRYPTATELADDLDRYLRHEPISVRPAGPVERAYKWARRNKAAAAAIGVGATAAVALVGLWTSFQRRTESVEKDRETVAAKLDQTADVLDAEKQRRERAERDRKRAEAERLAAERAKLLEAAERAASTRYFSQLRGAAKLWRTEPSRGARLLADPDACPDRLRGACWGVLSRLCREYLTLTGQPGTALAVSRDGTVIALGGAGAGAAVRVLDAETGRVRKALAGHSGAVTAVAFAAGADALASAGADGTVRLWDAETFAARNTLKAGVALQSVALSPNAGWVAAGPGGNPLDPTKRPTAIKLWHLAGAKESATDLGGHEGPVWALAASPDGATLASASADGTVRLWDVEKGACLSVMRHGGWVTSVAFAPDGKTLASGAADGTLRVWSLDGKEERGWDGLAAGVYGLAFSPDGTLASAHEGGSLAANQVRLWDPKTGKLKVPLDLAKRRILSVAFAAKGKALVAADEGGTVRFWHASPTEEALVEPAHLVGYAVAYSPAGDEIATGGGLLGVTGEVKLWDARTGAPRRALGTHKGKVLTVAYSPDGGILVSGATDGSVKIWDTKTGAERGSFRGHAKEVRCVAAANTRRLAASAGADRVVCVWDLDTGVERFRLDGHENIVMAAAFGRDDATLFTAGHDKTIRLWDVSTGKERAKWAAPERVVSLALSADGRTLFAGGVTQVQAWSVETGALLHTGTGHTSEVFGLAAARNGRALASGSADGTVRFWEQDGTREVMTLTPDRVQVKGLAFSPDGTALAGIGTDGKLRIWR